MIFGAVENWLSNWLTPIWLLSVGAVFGLALIGIVWALVFLFSRIVDFGGMRASGPVMGAVKAILQPLSRRSAAEVPMAVREGALWPLFIMVACMGLFAVVGFFIVQKPRELMDSLAKLPFAGTRVEERSIAVSDPSDPSDPYSVLQEHEVDLQLDISEIQRVEFHSDQNLTIATVPFADVEPGAVLELLAGEGKNWYRDITYASAFAETDIDKLYVRNSGNAPATLKITIVTAPPYLQVRSVILTGAAILIVFLLYVIQRSVAPRLSGIALATYKSEIAQPLFALLLILGVLLLFAFIFIPYNTLGEDIKMLKDTGMTLIKVFGIILAIWAASTSVADEIEGRTALTVLSKPVGRRSFIIGKYMGILWTVCVLFILLGLFLIIVTAYKPIYDARESSTQDVTWQMCHAEMLQVVAGLVLGFIEAAILGAISVAISTRLPMLANFVICLSIYFLGHLTSLIAQSSMGQFVFVRFFGQLIATIFPVLDHYSIEAAVAGGAAVPYSYLLWAALYGLIYSSIAMLLALVLFEDRDLA